MYMICQCKNYEDYCLKQDLNGAYNSVMKLLLHMQGKL